MTIDWPRFAHDHWEREPTRLPAPPPATIEALHALTVHASAPFRAGTRFGVTPDVQLLIGDGRLRAPGALLPDDPTPDAYHDRLDTAVPGHGHLLTVRQPLLLDFALWAAVREAIQGLWREVGWPNLPLTAEILTGDRFTQHAGAAEPPTHAAFTWILRGRMDVRLWDEAQGPPPAEIADGGVPTLSGGPGDLLYWPGDRRHVDVYRERCTALRLRVPVDRRLPFAALRDLLADQVHARRGHDETVPYFPLGADIGEPLARLTGLGDDLRDLVGGERLRRTLRVRWAALRSAAGLEPIPAPRDAVPLAPDTPIRLTGEIVRMPDGPRHEVWAVNGNVFTLPTAAADRVYGALRGGERTRVAEVCHALGDDKNVLALLERLYRLRGLDLAEVPAR
ncbi:hypothetical protein [Streptomyces acidiscabies]|uniref:Cupin n=1 Tax=Streptomyces acidiscabies TaxID=42234 RepID=A0AAP6BM36_9ACTN|nr:hypothetical protein [Streptomyces acidiscabies]MBZ3913439.1 hypothetical protein [Streptomyces acidiscabies]MDX2967316.1 hypothetical protein [Streptomyces acidiscabies]MDX3024411.1 hypothetical protein [Streptomyces acidiscabies]MDX3797076.1 hypothetical protein [Streptomyces acidiscabies]